MSVDPIQQSIQTQQIQQKPSIPHTNQDLNSSQTANNSTNRSSANSATAKILSEDKVGIQQSAAFKNLDTIRVIEEMNSRINNLVISVRESNEGIANSSDIVNQMHGKLESISKNFPPFAADSQERRDILMSYISLRKELIKLTVPPPPPEIYEKVTRMWDELFTKSGTLHDEIIPQLDNSSVDSNINSANMDLSVTYDKLSTLSSKITDALVKR